MLQKAYKIYVPNHFSVGLMQPDFPLTIEQIKFLASVYGPLWMEEKKKKELDCKFNHQNHPWCCERLTACKASWEQRSFERSHISRALWGPSSLSGIGSKIICTNYIKFILSLLHLHASLSVKYTLLNLSRLERPNACIKPLYCN